MTKVLKVDAKNPHKTVISLITEAVIEGSTIVYPTDTVYGLGTNALHPKSVLKIFKIKERPRNQALPIAIPSIEMAERLAFITEEAKKLMKEFWPGAMTIILRKKRSVPIEVTGGRDSIGLRMPRHLIPQLIMKRAGLPLIATSANKHRGHVPRTANEALRQIGGEVDFVLDAGRTEGGVPSTVVDLTRKSPTVIRNGAIQRKEIEKILGLLG
ncbi:threonylcarbamoyl-AMP synthase [Candidatus Bathyarchaeota archaeon]|nr:threonylcarbamoyl-AMP synthase [Candidatus Bathyarchaeota archaeon]